jgi:hypothetical protein
VVTHVDSNGRTAHPTVDPRGYRERLRLAVFGAPLVGARSLEPSEERVAVAVVRFPEARRVDVFADAVSDFD